MNKAILSGRLVRDPDIRWTQGQDQKCIARYTLAVDRRIKKDGAEQSADFISMVSFGKPAEFLEKYGKKGVKFNIIGRIQTGSYTNRDGQKVYTTDVVGEELEFAESKSSGAAAEHTQTDDDGFMNVPDDMDDEMPFS